MINSKKNLSSLSLKAFLKDQMHNYVFNDHHKVGLLNV